MTIILLYIFHIRTKYNELQKLFFFWNIFSSHIDVKMFRLNVNNCLMACDYNVLKQCDKQENILFCDIARFHFIRENWNFFYIIWAILKIGSKLSDKIECILYCWQVTSRFNEKFYFVFFKNNHSLCAARLEPRQNFEIQYEYGFQYTSLCFLWLFWTWWVRCIYNVKRLNK